MFCIIVSRSRRCMCVGQFNGPGDIAERRNSPVGFSCQVRWIEPAVSCRLVDTHWFTSWSFFLFFFFPLTQLRKVELNNAGNKTSFPPKLTSQLPRPTARTALTEREFYFESLDQKLCFPFMCVCHRVAETVEVSGTFRDWSRGNSALPLNELAESSEVHSDVFVPSFFHSAFTFLPRCWWQTCEFA